MRRHLDLTTLLAQGVADVVNKHRGVLGLDPLSTVTEQTSLDQGLASDDGTSFNRASAIRDVTALIDATTGAEALAEAADELTAALKSLDADPGS